MNKPKERRVASAPADYASDSLKQRPSVVGGVRWKNKNNINIVINFEIIKFKNEFFGYVIVFLILCIYLSLYQGLFKKLTTALFQFFSVDSLSI